MSDGKRNFFDLFDLPVSVDVNIDKLEINYKKLQKGLHPDNFVKATSAEQTSALRISSQVNDGYKILKNIETRIEYILTIKGKESKRLHLQAFLSNSGSIKDMDRLEVSMIE